MIKLTLPAPLAVLVHDDSSVSPRRTAVLLDAVDWPGFVRVLHQQHSRLADRVLSPSGQPADGIALVVNGGILLRGEPIELASGDEVSFIPQMAGG